MFINQNDPASRHKTVPLYPTKKVD